MKANEEAAEARRRMPDTLRRIEEDDWDAMDWAKGVKPGEVASAMGETGLDRVWSAPDLSFRPEVGKKTCLLYTSPSPRD